MKRILLFLAVAFIFGSVMPMMAQQRKAAPQRRATTTSAVPVIQRDHMEFLGLKMGGDVKAFEKALRQKGFQIFFMVLEVGPSVTFSPQ